jgi:hypothetical protein
MGDEDMRKLNIQSNGRPDNFQTPREAINILLPYLKKEWQIWECAWGNGNLYNFLEEAGFNVLGTDINGEYGHNLNFLTNIMSFPFDCIVTNPPYSLKNEFLARAYELNKPFAFLMPLTALEGKKRGLLYKKFGIELIIPNKRINFVTPSGKGSGAWFQVAWFCWKLNLPYQLNFVELK